MTPTAKLTALFEDLERDQGFSGAVLISRDSETLFEGAYGLASRQLDVPMTLETRFHIASVTKMFIAMCALVLVEDGRLSVTERPLTYLPTLSSLDEAITLHHLLSHTSGVRDVYDDIAKPHFEALKAKAGGMDLLAYLESQPAKFPPGHGWSYSSTGYLLVAYVLEAVAGMSFETLLRERVLEPLGMVNTGVDRPQRVNPGRAYGHTMVEGEHVNAENDALSPFDEGPGELYSTVGDLKRWCDALFTSPPVSARTLELMFTPHASIGPDLSYGYGWFLGPKTRTHGGHTPGFFARITQVPKDHLSVILLMNTSHIQPDPIVDEVSSVVAEG